MAHHGIRVSLERKGRVLEEFANPYAKRYKDFNGFLRSCIIAIAPDSPVELVIDFTRRFKQFTEKGVFIKIASEGITQSFWIDNSKCKVIGRHTLRAFGIWDAQRSDAIQKEIPIRAPKVLGKTHVFLDSRGLAIF